ncbi:MAG TPA: hypothetical protein V6C65_34080 [Allocoleopsis sp.]
MFKKTNKNPTQIPTPRFEASIPDPWETVEPEPYFPSPLELDRLLRQEHPLISAAVPHVAISAVDTPAALLPPPQVDPSPPSSPIKVLLQTELKLPSSFETMKVQIEQALALLYFAMTNPQQPAI